jgi:uncharacterized protein YegP (UPF0339 family)
MTRIKTILSVLLALVFGACTDGSGQDTQPVTESVVEPIQQKTPVAPGELAIVRHVDGQWYFELVGPKGQIYLRSEEYVEKASALNGILSVEENGVLLERYVANQLDVERWQLVLRAANNQVIGDGPEFASEDEALAYAEETRDLVAGIVQWKAAVTKGARFELWRETADNQWYFALRAEDGTPLVESEGYQGRTGAVNGIESVRSNGKILTRYATLEEAGAWYFTLDASNGQEIGRSPKLDSQAAAEAAIETVNQLLISERVAAPW